MSRIYIQTIAYNAQLTIHRCVKSILNQTYTGDITWDILDNGSNDDTLQILLKYADQNPQLNIYHIDKNCSPNDDIEHAIWDRFYRRTGLDICNDNYFCSLDSDDEYKCDFIEKALYFMNENSLDIVAVGSDFINSKTNTIGGIRKIQQNLVLSDAKAYSEYFSEYHQFFRTVWGKLYKMSLLKDYLRNDMLSYGNDTWFAFYTMYQAERVGILAESLHKYYMSPKSVSYKWDSKRINSDVILHKMANDFLMNRCGIVTSHNEEFLLLVYMSAIKDTLNVLLNSDVSDEEKLVNVLNIFSHQYTKQLAARNQLGALCGSITLFTGQRKDLFKIVMDWLLAREEVQDELMEYFCEVGEFVCAVMENASGWVFFNKILIEYLIDMGRVDDAKIKLFDILELIPDDNELLSMKEKLVSN